MDQASGDLGSSGPTLERVAGDGATIVQSSQAAGVGFARSLRWMNTTTNTIDNETVRVRSAGCTTDCGADDTYRIRAYETTAAVRRFNNAGSQNTVLLLQNPTDAAIAGTVYFWSSAGLSSASSPSRWSRGSSWSSTRRRWPRGSVGR